MIGDFFRRLRPGDELTTAWLNRARQLILQSMIQLGVNSGLILNSNPNGTWLAVAQLPLGAKLAITLSGGISACSGMTGNAIGDTGTAGTGNVYLIDSDYAGNLTVSSIEIPVFNFATTTGGIDASVLVWIAQNLEGNWYVCAVDCGN